MIIWITGLSGAGKTTLAKALYNDVKKKLWNRMTGNILELNNPANANGNINMYPNEKYS